MVDPFVGYMAEVVAPILVVGLHIPVAAVVVVVAKEVAAVVVAVAGDDAVHHNY